MSDPSPRRKTMLILMLVALAALAPAARAPVMLDLGVEAGRTGHATLQIGFASIHLAFGSGRWCPKTNSGRGDAAAGEAGPRSVIRLARHLLIPSA